MANQYTILKEADKAFEKGQYFKASHMYDRILKNKYLAESRLHESNNNMDLAVEFALLAGEIKRAMRLAKENGLETLIQIHIEEGVREKIDINKGSLTRFRSYIKNRKNGK